MQLLICEKKEAARRNPAASDLLEYTRINVYLLRRAAANAIASAPKIAAQVDGSGTAVTSATIRTGKMYDVDLPANENYTDDDQQGDAYWSNGFIKTIVITENTG